MRILLDELEGRGGEVASDEELAALYEPPDPWLRVNFVSTVDGAATGADGKSGSINNAADKRVFDLLRTQADAMVVGAGTLRVEGYAVPRLPLVVVSRRADVPTTLREGPSGRILMATWGGAEGLAEAREILGGDQLIVTGEHDMDLAAMRDQLAERGFTRLLSEGGPHLFHALLGAGLVDELDLTLTPMLVAGGGPRITAGPALELDATPKVLLEEDGTLIGRWFT
jgi:riboflavin biosynthesis pyrimidine reductase